MTDIPESDRIDGAPHPRATSVLFGHQDAETAILDAFNTARLHHAWMISGPRGVGKASFAWKVARFLLAAPDEGGMFAPAPPQTLDIPANHPIAQRMLALSEPRLFLLRRPYDEKTAKLKNDITVDEVRRMKAFFALSAADGGRRVAIIDALDEMNPSAANALLKLLEEPPEKVTFLLITHQPARLLPTIRSRCRALRLGPLNAADLSDALTAAGGDVAPEDRCALAELAGGSVGAAFEMTNQDGLAMYQALIDLLAGLPRMDRARLQSLTEVGRGQEARFDLLVSLIDLFLARTARAGAQGGLPPDAARGEGALIARLAAGNALAWANLAQALGVRARRGRAVNLDPSALVLDMLLAIETEARRIGVAR